MKLAIGPFSPSSRSPWPVSGPERINPADRDRSSRPSPFEGAWARLRADWWRSSATQAAQAPIPGWYHFFTFWGFVIC